MNKRPSIVSLSLPKTGTTFLESILAQIDGYVTPAVKEPSFFFERPSEMSENILGSLLAPGNRARGDQWYDTLFDGDEQNTAVDFSTNYWLYPDQVLEAASLRHDPLFLAIHREPAEQVGSYLAHLRRGHLPDASIETLCQDDPALLNLLDRMSTWSEDFRKLVNDETSYRFVSIDFNTLIGEPKAALVQLGIHENAHLDISATKQNPRSTPRFEPLNRLLFSQPIRTLGRQLPTGTYAGAIRIRKKLVKRNLRDGDGGTHASADKKFVENRYSAFI